jgi:hypothetical protein
MRAYAGKKVLIVTHGEVVQPGCWLLRAQRAPPLPLSGVLAVPWMAPGCFGGFPGCRNYACWVRS